MLRVWFLHHIQAAKNSLLYLLRQPFATAMTVIVIALGLSLPVLFWVFTNNLAQISTNWQQGGQISLYLDMQQSQAQETALLARVRAVEGVGQALLKTPKEGMLELQQQSGLDDLTIELPDNPLPAVIEVTPSLNMNTITQIEALYQRLKALGGVDEAKLDLQWVNRLHALLSFAATLTRALMFLLAATVVFIIGNTLRLAIQNRSEEIQVLKLIGATDAYIARPFLYTGLWYGIAGAVVALLLAKGFILSLGIVVSKLVIVYQMHYLILFFTATQVLQLLVLAAFLGWFGARLSVKKQLTSIEPYI